jgi:hypothetical protein
VGGGNGRAAGAGIDPAAPRPAAQGPACRGGIKIPDPFSGPTPFPVSEGRVAKEMKKKGNAKVVKSKDCGTDPFMLTVTGTAARVMGRFGGTTVRLSNDKMTWIEPK